MLTADSTAHSKRIRDSGRPNMTIQPAAQKTRMSPGTWICSRSVTITAARKSGGTDATASSTITARKRLLLFATGSAFQRYDATSAQQKTRQVCSNLPGFVVRLRVAKD